MLTKHYKELKAKIQSEYSGSLFTKVFAGWALLTFLISFNSFFNDGLLSKNSSMPCFPHAQECKAIFETFNLTPLPYSYSESMFFTLIFTLIVLAGFYIYKKEYFKAHLLLWILLIIKLFITLNNYGVGNFDYYDIAIIFIFLLYPSRIDLVKLMLVILYFLASTIKIHEGWILGTYFSSLIYGLPLVPDILIPFVTNIVIIMQIVGCWFLVSKNKRIAECAFYFFIFFHLYSTILVGYRYPITTVFSLIIIYVLSKDGNYSQNFSLKKSTAAFYIFTIFLFCLQSVAYIIPGDQKLTLEGNNYGLYMFEANHQCISKIKEFEGNEFVQMSYDSRNRCDPYIYLKNIQKNYCEVVSRKPVKWTFDHSINGSSLMRIVDEKDVCSLIYKPFINNVWIKTEKNASAVGKVYKNVTLTNRGIDQIIVEKDGYIFPSSLSSSTPVIKSDLQLLLERHVSEIKFFYWLLWFSMFGYMLYRLIRIN